MQSDIQSAQTFFAPYDDVDHPLVAAITAAKSTIYLADYSYNDPAVTAALIAAHERGVVVKCVLDRSQSRGTTEIPEVDQLRQAGIPLFVGTSSLHQIMHDKYVVIDGVTVCSGSYNFTTTAAKEDNFMDVIVSTTRGTNFINTWIKMQQFILVYEPQGVFNNS